MRIDHQTALFEIVKHRINPKESLGNVVGEILSISPDAVYRRYRGETLLTIFELEKLCKHFSISLDALFEMNKSMVMFNFQSLEKIEFSMDDYLQTILDGLRQIKAEKNPELILTINNTPLLQLLNYPHLIRFKLFFWAKTHVQIEEYKDVKFDYTKISDKTFAIGREILQIYNSIPSKEIYDPELLRGFTREIYYYFNSHHFEDPGYAIYLLDLLDRFLDHLKAQAAVGKKFIAETQPPASGNEFEMYLNDTFNGTATICFKNDAHSGIYITHNLMNFMHTSDETYIKDSLGVLNKQIANSSLISGVNERERNNYFHQIKNMINGIRLKMKAEMMVE